MPLDNHQGDPGVEVKPGFGRVKNQFLMVLIGMLVSLIGNIQNNSNITHDLSRKHFGVQSGY